LVGLGNGDLINLYDKKLKFLFNLNQCSRGWPPMGTRKACQLSILLYRVFYIFFADALTPFCTIFGTTPIEKIYHSPVMSLKYLNKATKITLQYLATALH
jgi:hypothetical protein